MRFVWVTQQGMLSPGGGAERPSSPEKGLGHREIAERQADLQSFLDRLRKKESVKESDWQKFEQDLLLWDKNGEVESMRTAGIGAKKNSEDYLRRHELLSKAFLSNTPENGFRFKVDFKGNNLAEWKVGAGDLLPPNVLTIDLHRNGRVISGIRGRSPETGRIGYYEESALKRGEYDYVAVHTGDEIEITGTETVPPKGTHRIFAEQLGVYQLGAASDAASMGDEILYDAKTGQKYPDREAALRARREAKSEQIKNEARARISAFMAESGLPSPEYAPDQKLNAKIEKRTAPYAAIIDAASERFNVPVNLIKAVIMQESGGDPTICSVVGAGGLMQLMPETAKGFGLTEIYPMVRDVSGKGRNRLDPRDERANPKKNINAGTQLLSQLLKKYDGNIQYALAGYNWGGGNVDKYLKGKRKMPRETQGYISVIPKMYNSLNKAGGAPEAVIEEGGSAVV